VYGRSVPANHVSFKSYHPDESRDRTAASLQPTQGFNNGN
jgi:hypothetical protein